MAGEWYDVGISDAVNGIGQDIREGIGVDEISKSVNESIRTALNEGGVLETIKMFFKDMASGLKDLLKPVIETVMGWWDGAANYLADQLSVPKLDVLNKVAEAFKAADGLTTGKTLDPAKTSEAVAEAVAAAQSGSSRLFSGIVNWSDEARAGAIEQFADKAKEYTYDRVKEATYESLRDAVLRSEQFAGKQFTDEQKREMLDALRQDTVATRFAEAEAERFAAAAYTQSRAAIQNPDAPLPAIQVASHDVDPAAANGAFASAARVVLTKSQSFEIVNQFNTLPESIRTAIIADDPQYKKFIEAMQTGKITSADIAQIRNWDEATVKRFVDEIDGANDTKVDRALSDGVARLQFSGNSLTIVGTDGSTTPFTGIVTQNLQPAAVDAPASAPAATPAPAPVQGQAPAAAPAN